MIYRVHYTSISLPARPCRGSRGLRATSATTTTNTNTTTTTTNTNTTTTTTTTTTTNNNDNNNHNDDNTNNSNSHNDRRRYSMVRSKRRHMITILIARQRKQVKHTQNICPVGRAAIGVGIARC